MTDSVQATLWEGVKALKPQRAHGVEYAERLVRGEPWLFIHNDITGQHARVNLLVRRVLLLIDGTRSLASIVDDMKPSVQEGDRQALAGSLVKLSGLGMLDLGTLTTDKLIQHRAQQELGRQRRPWHNPLAVRIPLIDPEPWLERVQSRTRWMWQPLTLYSSAFIVFVGFCAALLHLQEIGRQVSSIASQPQQWWQFLVVIPLLKCVHECAHALCIKYYRGTVNEAGITILILMPVPYIDASDIWRLDRKRKRLLVCASGMLAEMLVATVSLIVWLILQPGWMAELAFAMALTGSVTTLVFNANPLLKFDGYQILQDALDIPNLAPRSTQYLRYLCRRYLFRVNNAVSPVCASGERLWFLVYGILAAIYRWVLTLTIALYLVIRFPLLGSALAAFALFKLVVSPCIALCRYLASSAELTGSRGHAVMTLGMLTGCLLMMLFLIPFPQHTRAEGIVAVPHQAQLYAPYSGELVELYASSGEQVTTGQPLFRLEAPELQTRHQVVRSEIAVLQLDRQAALIDDPALVSTIDEDLARKKRLLESLGLLSDQLMVRAQASGRLDLDERYSRLGQFVREGAEMGLVVGSDTLLVKAVVEQKDIARIKQGVLRAQVRLAEQFSSPIEASLASQSPGADRRLPSKALAMDTTGGIAVASSESSEWSTVDPVFHIEIALPENTHTVGIGGKAFVSLQHSPEAIGKRVWQTLRRLILDELAL